MEKNRHNAGMTIEKDFKQKEALVRTELDVGRSFGPDPDPTHPLEIRP